jgi:hypothetical protein
MSRETNADRHRKQAEEWRTIAGTISDAQTRDQYIRMAQAYDALASNEEAVARNLTDFKK